MVGWAISVINNPIEEERKQGTPYDSEKILARWEAGVGSTNWLDRLVEDGKIGMERHGGYPDYYYGPAKEILPHMTEAPPPYKGMPILGDDYYAPAGWLEVTLFDKQKIAACPPDAQLTVRVYDLS